MIVMMESVICHPSSQRHMPVLQVQLRDAGVYDGAPLQVGAVNHQAMYHPLMPHVLRTRNAASVAVVTSTPLISSLNAPQGRCLSYVVAF
jgi:hypothetical protein